MVGDMKASGSRENQSVKGLKLIRMELPREASGKAASLPSWEKWQREKMLTFKRLPRKSTSLALYQKATLNLQPKKPRLTNFQTKVLRSKKKRVEL